MRAFFERTDDDVFAATPLTTGPWDPRAQHGGPPTALLARVLAAAVPEGMALARVTTEFVRPVPVDALRVSVDEVRVGRTVCRTAGRLVHLRSGKVVLEARTLHVRHAPAEVEAWGEPWPGPEGPDPFDFPFFQTKVGYHKAVDVRLLDPPWGATPMRCWARPVVDLVQGEATTAVDAALVLADAESGMGPPVDPMTHTYLNPDLTVYFARPPVGLWVGLDIRSWAAEGGAGLSESRLRDSRGVYGRSAQSLVVARR